MVFKFNDYYFYNEMSMEFINSLDRIVESNDVGLFKKIAKDLKLNFSLIGTFGAGMASLYPIVDKLVKNMNLNIEVTAELIVLLTVTSVSIAILEEKKSKGDQNIDKVTKDCKSMLEELKMSGIGNGIVKKVVNCIKSIKNIFVLIGKHIGAIIGGVIDMFAYTSLFIPIMNGVMWIIGKYDLNIDTLPGNFLGLAVGVGTIIAKHGIIDIINRIKSKFPVSKKRVMDEIETPMVQKFGDTTISNNDKLKNSDLIKEQ